MKKRYAQKMISCLSAILPFAFAFTFLPAPAFSDSPEQNETAKPFVFRIGTIAPAGVSYMKYIQKACKEFEEAIDGRLKFALYAGGVLGDEFDIVKMVQNGELDGALVSSFCLEKVVPEILVLTLPPLLFDDEFELSAILDKYEPIFAQYALERGIQILALFPVGCHWIFSSVPISGPADLEGKRLMCLKESDFCPPDGSDSYFSYVPLSQSEMESALSNGKVDVVYGHPALAVIMGLYPYVRSVITGRYCLCPMIVAAIVNPAAYHRLPEKTRSMMSSAIGEQREKVLKQGRRDNEIAMLGLMKRGVKIIQLTPEEIADTRKAVQPSWSVGVDKAYPRELLDDIIRDLEAYRAAKEKEGIR